MENPGQTYAPVADHPPEQDVFAGESDGEAIAQKVARIWARRQFIFRAVVAGTVISIVLAFVLPPRYESGVMLMPPDQALSTLAALTASSSSSGAAGLAASLLGVHGTGQLYMSMIGSRTVADRMIQRFDLYKVYGVKVPEYARLQLAQHTAVSEDRKSGIISIVVSDHDKYRAANMANAYVDEVNKLINEVGGSAAIRERDFLAQRIVVVKKDLDDSMQQFSIFASKNTAYDIPEQAKATLTAAARLQGELAAAEAEVSGLEQIYTANNARVREARGRVDELKRQLNDASAKPTGGAVSGDGLATTLQQLPKLGVTYADLFRKVTVNEAVYEALVKQYEFAKVQAAKDTPQLKVLDPAIAPDLKAFPKKRVFTLIGFALSLALSIVWIVAIDVWESVDPADPYKMLAIDIWRSSTNTLRRYTRRVRFRRTEKTPFHEEQR